MKFARFMAQPFGRIIRVVAGAAMMGIGLGAVQGTEGTVLAVVGVLPILTGVFNVCVLGPILRAPLLGRDVR